MKFKLDENLGARASELLRAGGHDVATVPEQNMCSAPDAEVIEACRIENRCLVTLDVEFGNPFLFKPSHYEGIALLRLAPKLAGTDIEVAINTLLVGLTKDSISRKLWIIQRDRIRIYQEELHDEP